MEMEAKRFNEIAEARIEHCRKTLLLKGEEYSREGDRLHNFKSAGVVDGENTGAGLVGYAEKTRYLGP
jgi:hypothetical protein